MSTYVLQRIAQTIPVMVLASILVFIFIRQVPGDPSLILAGPDATPEVVEAVREDIGLNRPLTTQYFIWLRDVVQGDLGRSYINGQPISSLIGSALPATIELTLAALILAVLVGVPTGIFSAVRQGAVDRVITTGNALALGIPNFYLAILMIMVFAVWQRWLPPGGRVAFTDDPGTAWRFLILPTIALFPSIAAAVSRFTRAAMLEVLHADYIRTAQAKGLSNRVVITRHALQNALIPVITFLGMQFGRLMGGAVIIENVFAWPGVGRLMLQGVLNRDYAVVQAGLLLLVSLFVLINLVVDLLYGAVDPRVSQAARGT